MNEAMRDWVTNVEDTYYIIGTAAGPAPLPGHGPRLPGGDRRPRPAPRCWRRKGRLPDAVVACIGGGSNAIGMFHPFLNDEGVQLIGVEASGHGLDDRQALRIAAPAGAPACCTATAPTCCRTRTARSLDAHSISAGLDYPGIGPEHAFLFDIGRARYLSCTDDEALEAFKLCAELEGIIPALESAHAIARLGEVCRDLGPEGIVAVSLSGRGDKDIFTVASHLEREL